jgi:sugar lactone lactonase YvrE
LFWYLGAVVEVLKKLTTYPQVSFNDAKCDSSGRLWFGTNGKITDVEKLTTGGVVLGGALYNYDGG